MSARSSLSEFNLLDKYPLADALFSQWQAALGKDATAYRNHVYRVLNFALALNPVQGEAQEQLVVAAVFHDLGIWSDGTFDYLEPSVARAQTWLEENDHSDWGPIVAIIIREHHKIRRYQGAHGDVVESLRRADLTDLSLGLIRWGLPRDVVRRVRKQFPNTGFHLCLLKLAVKQLLRKPWRPMPMMKW